MTLNVVLLTICICIEIYHVVFIGFFFKKYYKRTYEIATCVDAYDKFFKTYLEFAEMFLDNTELHEQLGTESLRAMADINTAIGKFGTYGDVKRKILNTCSTKELLDFLLQQAIEFVYWIVIIILAFSLPAGIGVVVFIVATVLGMAQSKFNKNHKNVVMDIVDSIFCIAMFVSVLCMI